MSTHARLTRRGSVTSTTLALAGSLTGASTRGAAALGAAPRSPRRTTPGFIYVTGLVTGTVAAIQVAADGTLTRLPDPADTGAGGIGLTASHDGRVVYICPSSGGGLFAFAVQRDGGLRPVPGTPVQVPGSPSGIALSPDGRRLYVTGGRFPGYSGGGQVTTFAIRRRVPVQLGPSVDIGQTVDGVSFPVVSHDGRHLYVGLQQGLAVADLVLGPGGRVTGRGARKPTNWPLFPVIHPSGRFLYIPNEYFGTVSGFSLSTPTGRLTELAGSPFPISGEVPHGVTFTPDGRFAYVPNVDGNRIDGYAVSRNGNLTALPTSPYRAGEVGQFAGRAIVSPDGGTLFAVDVLPTGKVYSFRIARDGSLTPAAPAVETGVPTSDGPDSVFVPVPAR